MDDRREKLEKSGAKPRKKRRLLKAFAIFVLAAIGLVVALPWLLGTPSGRDWVVGRINARLTPGAIRLGRLGLSWTGPIELGRVALLDPNGKTVFAADRVTLDRGLVGLVASRPDYGTVTIDGATVDFERRADGSIDLLDALASILKPGTSPPTPPVVAPPANPAPAPAAEPSPTAVKIVLNGGSLKLASPELVEPFEAGSIEGSVTIAPGRPIEVSATLGGEGRSVELRSTLQPSGDREITLVSKAWPIHLRHHGVEARTRLEGNLATRQVKGLWSAKGDAALVEVAAEGPALQGDHLKLDRVAATCDVEQTSTGWAIRKLDLTSPVAQLQGSGTIPALDGTPVHLDGQVDLALLGRMLPNALNLRDNLTVDRGSAIIRVDLTASKGVERLELVARLEDFAANEAGRDVKLHRPVYLTGKATRSGDKVAVEALEVKAAGVDVTASGDLESGVKLAGTVELVPLMAQLRDVIDLGKFDLSGRARLGADYQHLHDSYKGRFAVEFDALKVVGATAEPIVRDQSRLEGWAIGPARSDGMPKDWQRARVDLKSADLKLDLRAESTEKEADLAAGFEIDVTSPVPGRFAATAKFRRGSAGLEIDELIAGLTPSDPQAAPGTVALAVKGKFDPVSGEGTFGPIPGQPVGAIGLGPDGLKVSGVGKADRPLKVDASMFGDLGAVDRLLAFWSGSPPKGLGGLWAVQAVVGRSVAGKLDVDGKVFVPDLAMASTSKGPLSIAIKAGYNPEIDRLDVASLDLGCQFGRLGISGGMVETQARRFFDVTGTIEPNWATIDPLLAAKVEPNARVRATSRAIHLAGSLRADSTAQLLNQVVGEVGLEISEARAFGVTLGTTPIVLRVGQGLAKFDPIATTMNDGPVSIVADLAMDGDQGVWLRLGSSKIDGAAINEAVSNSILAYVAPVLAKSTAVTGRVTMVIDRAFVPITATGPMALDGAMALQDVIFQPGPLASELTSITGRAVSDLRLNEAMFVKVRDGRVEQHGLSIPLGGNGLAVAVDGSVGFDETLDLKATIPVSPKTLGLAMIPGQDAGGANVALPIRGTLARPSVDRKALGVALREAAKGVGEKRLKSEAARFLERLAGPKSSSGEPRSKP